MSMLGRMFGFASSEHYAQGIRLFDQGLYHEAIRELEQVGQPGDRADALMQRLALFYIAEAYANLGTAALQHKNYEQARDILGRALALNPNYADLHLQYGLACRRAGQPDQALSAFEQALAINPRFLRAHIYRGLILCDLERPGEAVASFRRAAGLDEAYRGPALDAALAGLEAGHCAPVQALFEPTVAPDPDDVAFHARLGTDLYRRGMYEEAADAFRKALAISPDYPDLRNHLGICLNAQGHPVEAIEEFRRALAINSAYLEARTNLALTLQAAGHGDEAAEEFRRVLERDPHNSIARGHLTR